MSQCSTSQPKFLKICGTIVNLDEITNARPADNKCDLILVRFKSNNLIRIVCGEEKVRSEEFRKLERHLNVEK